MRKERESVIHVMKTIKKALDPNNIMNPYKMMDWEEGIITHLRYPVDLKGARPGSKASENTGGGD